MHRKLWLKSFSILKRKKGVALNISWERTKQAYFDAYEHANKLSHSGQPDFNVLRELCTAISTITTIVLPVSERAPPYLRKKWMSGITSLNGPPSVLEPGAGIKKCCKSKLPEALTSLLARPQWGPAQASLPFIMWSERKKYLAVFKSLSNHRSAGSRSMRIFYATSLAIPRCLRGKS